MIVTSNKPLSVRARPHRRRSLPLQASPSDENLNRATYTTVAHFSTGLDSPCSRGIRSGVDSPGNANWAEFCDPQLDAQINSALAAQSNNSPDAAALWAQADRTATDQAPAVPLNIPSNSYLVSARVGNSQFSLTAPFGVLLDQLWVR